MYDEVTERGQSYIFPAALILIFGNLLMRQHGGHNHLDTTFLATYNQPPKRKFLSMKRIKTFGLLMCLQFFLLCVWAVSAGCAQTLVNIDNRTPFAVKVTVTCMQCSAFGWGSDNDCWDTGNNVVRSVPGAAGSQFQCAAGSRIFIRNVLVRNEKFNKSCTFVPPENVESTWHVQWMIGGRDRLDCRQ